MCKEQFRCLFILERGGKEEKGCENFMQGWVTLLSFMMLGNAFIIIRLKVSHYFIAQAVLSCYKLFLYFSILLVLVTFDVPWGRRLKYLNTRNENPPLHDFWTT